MPAEMVAYMDAGIPVNIKFGVVVCENTKFCIFWDDKKPDTKRFAISIFLNYSKRWNSSSD